MGSARKKILLRRFNRRDINIEGHEIFGDAKPDPVDCGSFGLSKIVLFRIAVERKPRGNDIGSFRVGSIPNGVRGNVTVEIKINSVLGIGFAVKIGDIDIGRRTGNIHL